MNEGHEDASDNIRFRIWSGYYDQDEVFDIVTDEADGEDEEGLAEYTDQAGNVQRKLFKNVQENKALGRAGLHAEVVMDRWMAKQGITPNQVKRVYSEYYPCMDGCRQLLGSTYSNAQVTFSFIYDTVRGPLAARGRAHRNALFDRLGLP